MTTSQSGAITDLAHQLRHVRWIAGGTGSGKTTATRILADHHDVLVYDGDRGERGYVSRCTPQRHPRMWALLQMTPEQRSTDRTAKEIFEAMPCLHGETFPLVIEDLLALPDDRPIVVDDFRTLPREVAPLLTWTDQAVFLLPTAEFRHRALRDRYADPKRARANWGDGDHSRAFANRLARDDLWDAEVRRQAAEVGTTVISVDGSRNATEMADQLAARFRLTRRVS